MKFIGSRKDLTQDKLEALEAIVMDSTKAEAIYESAKMSMGKLAGEGAEEFGKDAVGGGGGGGVTCLLAYL